MTVQINLDDLVRQLIVHPIETEWLEFKLSDAEPKVIGQNISALANAAALSNRTNGYIIWGIHDETRQIIGTKFNPETRKIQNQDLRFWLQRNLDPKVDFTFNHIRLDGQPIIILVIPSAFDRPIRFKNEAFIRIGSHTTHLRGYPEIEKQLWKLSDNRSFEKNVGLEGLQSADVLNLLDHQSYFNLSRTPIPPNPSGILKALEHEKFIVPRDDNRWDVLNLGMIAFARNLADAGGLGRKSVRIAKYSGPYKTNSRQEELSVGYAAGFSNILSRIQLATTDETFNGGIRKEEPRFPLIAVREVVANALIHQDFTVRGSGPLIEIFEDRMEITNPGAPLVEAKMFINTRPESRNDALSALLRRIGICEELGSGWDNIVTEIEKYHLPAPRIEVFNKSTRIILYAAKPLSEMNSLERNRAIYLHACLRYADGRSITNSTVRKRFGMDHTQRAKASRFLGEALEAEEIVIADPNAGRKFMRYYPHWVLTPESK